MKIQPNEPQQTPQTGLGRIGSTPGGTPSPARPEPSLTAPAQNPAVRVELSGRARELHAVVAAANAAPDVRAEKVADAKARVDAGTYTVDAKVVARRMLDVRA